MNSKVNLIINKNYKEKNLKKIKILEKRNFKLFKTRIRLFEI